jgi:adenylate cyclase
MAPGGQWFFNIAAESQDETVRRSLESCGAANGVACMIIAVDDGFVVPIPTLFRATGFFRAAANPSIIADARDDVARKLADAPNGWSAVAVGTAGRPGLGLNAADERTAVNAALADCAGRDSDCHVLAIGPFTVGPAN